MRTVVACTGYLAFSIAITVVISHRAGSTPAMIVAGILIAMACGILYWRHNRRTVATAKLLTWIDQCAKSPSSRLAFDNDVLREWPAFAQHFDWALEQLSQRMELLNRSQSQQQRVVHYMIDGVIVVNATGRVVSANPAARRLMGFHLDATQERPLVDIIRIPEIVSAVAQVLKEGKSQEVTVNIGTREGRSIRVQAALLPDEPQHNVLLTLHDETRLRALEQLRREFIANVSHELKTPLASVKGYAETLLDGALADQNRARRFTEHIAQQADRLEALITDMLTLARAQAAPEVISITKVNLADVIDESIAAYSPVAERKPVNLKTEEVPETLHAAADRESLLTVINNLVGNAVRYTQAHGEITVRAWAEGQWCVIAVCDNGPGIPHADQERIFERFYRVEKARDSRVAGTGLGLAIAKNLVLNMHGNIRVKSDMGQGSQFEIRLPLIGRDS